MGRKKKQLVEESTIIWIEGNLGELVEELIDLRDEHGPGAYISPAHQNTYRDCYCEPLGQFQVRYTREETDEEYKERIAQEKANKAALKEANKRITEEAERVERAEYERLKAKYDPS